MRFSKPAYRGFVRPCILPATTSLPPLIGVCIAKTNIAAEWDRGGERERGREGYDKSDERANSGNQKIKCSTKTTKGHLQMSLKVSRKCITSATAATKLLGHSVFYSND